MKLVFLLFLGISIAKEIPPIAVFHGFSNYCEKEDTATLVEKLTKDLGSYVECIEMGNGFIDSIFRNLTELAMDACDKLIENPKFQGNFSIIGISQGNLISRYIIEKCPIKGRVVSYLGFEGPQLGVAWIPKFTCGPICDLINELAAHIALTDLMVGWFAPSSYYRPQYHNDLYVELNVFLRDLNNEKDEKNSTYKEKMTSLEKVMLIKGKEDAVIGPNDSSWFEFFDEEGEKIVPLKESKFYIDDFIGIRALDEAGKIEFVEFVGEHVKYTEEEYQNYILRFFAEVP